MELRLPAPCLVVLVGAAGAGKTTWATTWFEETEIVSSDRLRGMVGAGEDDQKAGTVAFSLLEQIVTERTKRGLTTVIDTLGLDRDNRRRWVEMAHAAGMPAFAVTSPLSRTRSAVAMRPGIIRCRDGCWTNSSPVSPLCSPISTRTDSTG